MGYILRPDLELILTTRKGKIFKYSIDSYRLANFLSDAIKDGIYQAWLNPMIKSLPSLTPEEAADQVDIVKCDVVNSDTDEAIGHLSWVRE